MGAFNVQFEIANPQEERWLTLEGLVDTGSTYTWVPREVLGAVSLAPQLTREFETADGRVVSRDLAVAQVRLQGETLPTLVVFADPGDAILLGVVTLEEFGLGVDTVNRKLVPIRGLAMGRRTR